jgi:hypothetical protein
MDVDPGTFINACHFLSLYSFSTDIPVPSTTVRLLPFSHVPGMSFTSPLFLKAVSVIAKQQNSSSSVATDSLPVNVSVSGGKGKKKKVNQELGMFHFKTLL